jgi:hypothetical protein
MKRTLKRELKGTEIVEREVEGFDGLASLCVFGQFSCLKHQRSAVALEVVADLMKVLAGFLAIHVFIGSRLKNPSSA